jgi:hypothetical protein
MIRIPMRHIRFERIACGGGALICYAAAFVLMPSGVRSQLAAPLPAATVAPLIRQTTIVPIAPARDAFAPRAAFDDDAAAQSARILPTSPPVVARMVEPHRPNLGGARVTAIATGEAPSAIVEIDGVPRAVSVGDRLPDGRISAIGDAAIELDNGARLPLAPAEDGR